ncbi:synaptic vesicle membrane protein VAT-1 homolog [Schistocerca piceifrons]|uniref:synaptic vesicle membrane protein VAT-1 homolog n=1 Tax=Schistocerca piceifrons TaxID=274613 RepID=UPI001F5FA110|nr:synaptic vesicle membrane protein VAT-1 homolog [Schistocerca piceifrons]
MDSSPLQFTAPSVIQATSATRSVLSVTLSGHGDFDKVKFEKAPLPVRLKADLIEVEVFYCGMNFTDNYLRLGIIRSTDFPVIMGSECTGVVRRVGCAVTNFEVGQPVLCLRMQGGLFRRLVHVRPRNCFPLPSTVSLVNAAGLGFNSLLAYLCLFWSGRLRENQTLFMQSIGGGVGTSVVQLAQTVRGVTILGTASDSKRSKLLSLGLTRVFHHEEDYVEEILEAYPDGLDMVINSNGGDDVEKCIKLLKPFGRLIIIGSNSSAAYPKACWLGKPTWNSGNIASSEIIRKNVVVTGVNAGDFLENSPQGARCVMEQIFRLHASRKIKPIVDCFLSLCKVTDGLRKLSSRKNYGKVVLVVRL